MNRLTYVLDNNIYNFDQLIEFIEEKWDYEYYHGRKKIFNDLEYLITSRNDYYEKKYLDSRRRCCTLLNIIKGAIDEFIIFQEEFGDTEIIDFFNEKLELMMNFISNGIYILNIEEIENMEDIDEENIGEEDDPGTQILSLIMRINNEIDNIDWKNNQIVSKDEFLNNINNMREELINSNKYKLININYNIKRNKDIEDIEDNKNNKLYIDDIYKQIEQEIKCLEKIMEVLYKYCYNQYIDLAYDKLDQIDYDIIIENIEEKYEINFEENRSEVLGKREADKKRNYKSRRDENGLTKKQLQLEVERQEVIKLKEEGLSVKEIIQKLNLSKSKVYRLLKDIENMK